MTSFEFLESWHDDKSFVEAFTSGSTGTPKLIHLDKGMMVRSAKRTIDFFGITMSSRLHLCLDCEYIAGKMMVVRADIAHCLITHEAPSNDLLASAAMNIGKRITLLAVVPSQLKNLFGHPDRLSKVDNLLVGGAPIPQNLRQRLADSPIPSWESYGMTETASHVAIRRITADSDSPFTLLDGIKCSLSDAGTLVLHSIDFPKLITNDCAEILSSTSFRLLGRKDNVIISGGLKIHPEILENQCASVLSQCQPCYITSCYDEKWGERVVLATISKPEVGILKVMREKLGPVKSPKGLVILSNFEYTSSGKLKRQKIASLDSDNVLEYVPLTHHT